MTVAVDERLPPGLRDVLPLWAGLHLGGALLVLLVDGPGVRAQDVGHWLDLDYAHNPLSPAFQPLWPLVLRLAGVAVATAAAAVAGLLGVLVVRELAGPDGPVAARWAVGWQLLVPWAAFLLVPYSEALFLALAPAAWLAARRGRWGWAGVLGSAAVLTRLTGLPLALGLLVLALTAGREGLRHRWPVLLPGVAFAVWTGVLAAVTGHWDAQARAEELGWGRHLAPPWQPLHLAVRQLAHGFEPVQVASELTALVVLVVASGCLVRSRRWAEAALVGSTTLLLGCTSVYGATGRGLLVAWPVWLLAGRWSARHPAAAGRLLAVGGALGLGFLLQVLRGAYLG